MKDIVIYGAGGAGREIAQLLDDINERSPQWTVLGYLADDAELHGRIVGDLPVLGNADWVRRRAEPIAVAIGVGSPSLKRRLVDRVRTPGVSFPVLMHPTVTIGRRVSVGEGTIVCAASVITVDIRVGAFSMVNHGCTITHDDVLGDYTTLGPGVNVSGNVTIGSGTDLGTGSQVIQGVTIGEWSIVGAGAVVCRDLPANVTAVGVPARVIKNRVSGWYRDEHA